MGIGGMPMPSSTALTGGLRFGLALLGLGSWGWAGREQQETQTIMSRTSFTFASCGKGSRDFEIMTV